MQIAVMSRDRGLDLRQIATCPCDDIYRSFSNRGAWRWRGLYRGRWRREIGGRVTDIVISILDGHDMRGIVFVVAIAGYARRLRARRCGWVRPKFGGEVLLEALDDVVRETCDSPEHVNPIRGRLQDVRGPWNVGAAGESVQDASPVLVCLKEQMPDGANRVLRPRADTRSNGVDADLDVELMRIHGAEPGMDPRFEKQGQRTDPLGCSAGVVRF